jgi:uncharacterized iron-regulated membrane protein
VRRPRGRRVWIWLHKWAGLVLGAQMALLGVTGSVIVFYRELDVALNPALFAIASTTAQLPPSAILHAADAAAGVRVTFLFAPDPVQPVWTALWPRNDGLWSTALDPGTGAVLGSRDYDGAFALTVYRLHSEFLLKRWWGEEMVGVVGLVLLLSAGSGVYLWWPRRMFWRSLVMLRTRPRQILYLDLHNLLGVWSSAVLLVVAFTGVAVVFPALVRPLVGAPPPPVHADPVSLGGPAATTVDVAIQLAMHRMPGAVLIYVNVARAPDHVWRIGLRPRDMNAAVRSTAEITVDAQTGAIVDDHSPASMSFGERFMTAQLWVHNGALLGWPGRIAVCLSGLVLPAIFGTGVLLWLRKRRARRALGYRRQY